MQATAEFLESSFKQAGYVVKRQQYSVNNQSLANLEVEIPGVEQDYRHRPSLNFVF
ncbi:hypothetical protein QUB80_26845 [Chlorogloeopsis sp. ULAP01]|uniref:hypothetical protein n=1 Tax=Chlorogloeopsis sp. ULAP01 TaxID=3056483 RepID=UPI0025AAA387|nr:hypothetical protein [Chlorogloeopsis sp. ULAP01]MDM9384296.1 hypothetical protein [Chlorogloeopsis sp. ULAP01]